MATAIDSLFVELGLDVTKFSAGQKEAIASFKKTGEAARQQAKQIEAAGTQSAEFYRKLRNGVMMFYGALTAGRTVRDFINEIRLGDAELGRMSSSLNLSTEALSAWQNMVQSATGNANSAITSLAAVTQKLTNIKLGGTENEFFVALQRLGVSYTDAQGKPKTAAQIITDISSSRTARGLDDATYYQVTSALGIDRDTAWTARNKNIPQELQAARGRGVADNKSAKEMQELNTDLTNIKQIVDNIARTFLVDLEPGVHSFLTALQEFLKDKDVQQGIKDLSTAIGDFLKGVTKDDIKHTFETIKGFIHDIIDAIGGWKNASEILIALWLGPKVLRMLGLFAAATGGPLGLAEFLAALAVMKGMEGDSGDPATNAAEEQRRMDNILFNAKLLSSVLPNAPGQGASDAEAGAAIDRLVQTSGGELTRIAAGAIVGNLQGESSLNPHVWDPSHTTYGIAQWDAKRKADIEAHAGKSMENMTREEQLDAIIWEMKTKYPDLWKKLTKDDAGDYGKLTQDVLHWYEAPKDQGEGQLAKRMNFGKRAIVGAGGDPNHPHIGSGLGPGMGATTPPRQPLGPGRASLNVNQINIAVANGTPSNIAKGIKVALAGEFVNKPLQRAAMGASALA